MDFQEIIFTKHTVQRMFERHLSTADIRDIIASGEIVAEYLTDIPQPNLLILGWNHDRPIHVVLSSDPVQKKCYVITAYQPDPNLWSHDYKRRIT